MEYWENRDIHDLKGEVWKPVEGSEELYQVSNLGRVKSIEHYDKMHRLKHEMIRKQYHNEKGYLLVGLYKEGKDKKCKVHRLVAQAFLSSYRNDLEVNHINSQRDCNLVSNLECITHKENINYGGHTPKQAISQGKPVVATNKDTGDSYLFSSTRACARFIYGRDDARGSNISRCCNHDKYYKSQAGYTFEWYNKKFEITPDLPYKITEDTLKNYILATKQKGIEPIL